MEEKIRLGISTCLLGEKVRYDGGHKFDAFLVNTLGQFVEYVPVCPEVESGFSVPRESMRLEGDPQNPRLRTTKTKIDLTDKMLSWAQQRVLELEKEELCGYIFKSKSPSSGYLRVKVYNETSNMPVKQGMGLFARAFTEHFPLMPVEEEGRLQDPQLRENFITRIFVLKRWQEMLKNAPNRAGLVNFHTRHKLMLMAHSPLHYRSLGKMVAEMGRQGIEKVREIYQTSLMQALQLKTTVKKNVNVLQHIMGYFKKEISAGEKEELLELFDHYARGYLPLIVPITLLNHYVRKYEQPYLKEQYYLNPHPVELQLRNHV